MRTETKRVLGLAFLLGSFVSAVGAEVLLKDASEIIGQWTLESVAPGLDKAKIAENRVWDFRADGKVVTSGFNRHFGREDVQEFKYQVANGKILADNPGRPGKPLEYQVYEKSGDSMVLKGGLEGFYFFKKK